MKIWVTKYVNKYGTELDVFLTEEEAYIHKYEKANESFVGKKDPSWEKSDLIDAHFTENETEFFDIHPMTLISPAIQLVAHLKECLQEWVDVTGEDDFRQDYLETLVEADNFLKSEGHFLRSSSCNLLVK